MKATGKAAGVAAGPRWRTAGRAGRQGDHEQHRAARVGAPDLGGQLDGARHAVGRACGGRRARGGRRGRRALPRGGGRGVRLDAQLGEHLLEHRPAIGEAFLGPLHGRLGEFHPPRLGVDETEQGVGVDEVGGRRLGLLQQRDRLLRLAHREAHQPLIRQGLGIARRQLEDAPGLLPDLGPVGPAHRQAGEVEPGLDVVGVTADALAQRVGFAGGRIRGGRTVDLPGQAPLRLARRRRLGHEKQQQGEGRHGARPPQEAAESARGRRLAGACPARAAGG